MIQPTCTTYLKTSSSLRASKREVRRFLNKLVDVSAEQTEHPIDKSTFEFLKNLKLTVNNLHIRYEDDCIAGSDSPYSFGLTLHVLMRTLNFYIVPHLGVNRQSLDL